MAPRVFSFRTAATRFSGFLDRFSRCRRNRVAFVDLSQVEEIGADGIVAFLATMKNRGISARGNLPKNLVARHRLLQSGFFEHVELQADEKVPARGRIDPYKGKKVDCERAGYLAYELDGGRAALLAKKSTYTILIEAMANTKAHSRPGDTANSELWWVIGLPEQAGVEYAFVDCGVGVLRSRKVRSFMGRAVEWFRTPETVLEKILTKQLRSRTGERFRGKGLPEIRKRALMGHVGDLMIVANDAWADVTAARYRHLTPAFRGTLIAWRVAAPDDNELR